MILSSAADHLATDSATAAGFGFAVLDYSSY